MTRVLGVISALALFGLCAGAVVLAFAGFLYQAGVIDLQTAFGRWRPSLDNPVSFFLPPVRHGFLATGAYVVFLSAAVSFVMLVLGLVLPPHRIMRLSAVTVILSGLVLWTPYQQSTIAASVPPIHDITTDTEDPPRFVDVVPLREADNARNPPDYAGARVAEAQKRGYPGLGPLQVQAMPDAVFPEALAAAKEMGWTIVASVREEGRIEATDRTFWFGFRDDVVIRLRAEDGGTRIDVRSKSRVGGSDIGANARRITTYLDRLAARLS